MFQALLRRRPANLKDDLLSGLTVALALVPEAVAFALIAGVPVMVGLHAAFIMGLFAAVFGGRPGMISGATGAMAVVLIGLPMVVREHYGIAADAEFIGDVVLQHIFVAVGLAGIIQIGCGLARLGKFIRMVPHSVMLGFVNGLAIVIFLAQFGAFKDADGAWLATTPMVWMVGLAVLTMVIIALFPRLTKAVPAPLVGIAAISALVLGVGIDTTLLRDMPGWELGELSFRALTAATLVGLRCPDPGSGGGGWRGIALGVEPGWLAGRGAVCDCAGRRRFDRIADDHERDRRNHRDPRPW